MIAAPVSPMSAASVPPIAIPIKPPESLPSSVIRPRKLDPDAEAERPHIQKVAAGEQEPAEADERDRQHVRGGPDDVVQHVGKPRADCAAVEAQVEDGREDEAQRQEGEAEELVLVLRARSLRPLLHARRDAWTKRPLLPSSSHARSIRRVWVAPSRLRRLRGYVLRRRRARRPPGSRSRGSRPSPPRGPCRPGRSARSRFAARPGCRGGRSRASTPGPSAGRR